MATSHRKPTKDPLVEEMMARFEHAYNAYYSDFEAMDEIQKTYGNKVDEVSMPTISLMGIPMTFVAVEEQLPFAMQYLFPKNRWVRLLPDTTMDADRVRLVEDDLIYTLRRQMQLVQAALPSVKDCYKFAVGYGLIDTEYVTPPQVVLISETKGGKLIGKARQMRLGQRKQVVCYRYLPPVCVVPMPDGANVEGPNRASGHFVLDLKNEVEFRDLYEDKDAEGKPYFQGSPDDIIAEALSNKFDARLPPADILYALSGRKMSQTNTGDKKMPVVVPILRCYFENEHVWIANGRTKIHHVKDKYQTLRSDLVKWSAWPDGQKWRPLGVTEASQSLAWGTNIWYNGLVDLAMYIMNPTRLINVRALEDPRNVGRGPRQDIKITTPPEQAVGYLRLPDMPGQLFTMGDILQRLHGSTNAQMGGIQEGTPGLVRGGVNALEAMMGTSTGRQLLAAMILKTGGFSQCVEKTLIKKQLMVDTQESFIEPAFDERTGKMRYEEKTVTVDDFRNVFRVELDLPVERLNSASAFMERSAYFDRARQEPDLFDWRAMYEELTGDDSLIRRTMLPKAIVEQRQARMAEARMKAAEQGNLPTALAGPSTQGEQALQGAAFMAGQ